MSLKCPSCVHSLAGFHISQVPNEHAHHGKPTDEKLYCVWCHEDGVGGWCIVNYVVNDRSKK